MGDKVTGIIKWVWPLVALFATIYAVKSIIYQVDFTVRDDGWVAVGIGVSFIIATVFLVCFNSGWTVRSCGQLATYLGDSILYLGAGAYALGWRDGSINKRGYPAAFSPEQTAWIRALFLVGGPLLVVGLFWWGIARFNLISKGNHGARGIIRKAISLLRRNHATDSVV